MPSTDIKEIIARRTDLGTFIVHLTKDALGQNGVVTRTARDNLVSIIRGGVISACTPFGHGTNTHRNNPAFPKQKHLSVCFSETPLEYLYLLTEPIEGRRCCFEPYGIAVTKKIARKSGANPVLYADITCGHDWDIANAFTDLNKKNEP